MLAVDAPSPPSAISRTAASRIAPRFSGLLTRAIALTRLQAPAPTSTSQTFPQKYFKTVACFRHHENTTPPQKKPIISPPYSKNPHKNPTQKKFPPSTRRSPPPLRQPRH